MGDVAAGGAKFWQNKTRMAQTMPQNAKGNEKFTLFPHCCINPIKTPFDQVGDILAFYFPTRKGES